MKNRRYVYVGSLEEFEHGGVKFKTFSNFNAMRKFAEEICLLDQPFVKDPSITVAKYIANAGKNIKVVEFARLEKGEGIQKKEESFADEVASMIK